MHESNDERVVCAEHPVVANKYVKVPVTAVGKTLEHATHKHVDVVDPNVFVVVVVPTHVAVVHVVQVNGVTKVAPESGEAGMPGVSDGVPVIPVNTNDAVVASPTPA